MDVLVDVSNQRIRLSTHINAFVAGTKSFIRSVFNLSDEWRDLNKYADQEIEFVITDFKPRNHRIIGDRKQILVERKEKLKKELFERIEKESK